MTSREARQIIRDFYGKESHSEEEEFMFIESLEFLIKTNKDTDAMMQLGGHYYGQKKFDLALKYYELASANGSKHADEALGYIWYYGRTGQKDYEQAFKHFSKAAERGNIVATYKLADMYKNGYYVEKDYDKYCQIIEDLYPEIKDTDNVFDPLPEIFTRLARIRVEQGNKTEAINLYKTAWDFQAQRLVYDNFFGDLNIMKWIVEAVYELVPFGAFDDPNLYDLYYLLKKPGEHPVRIVGEITNIRVVEEEGEMIINYQDKWYRNVDEFMGNAEYNGDKLTELYNSIFPLEGVTIIE